MIALARLAQVAIMAVAVSSAQQQRARTVMLKVLDSFGNEGVGCRVTEFIVDDDETRHQLASTGETTQPDYGGRFDGLIGHDIPFGKYLADVKCSSPPGAGGRFFPAIDRLETLIVVSHFAYDGDDYFLFRNPLLTVSVRYAAKKRAKPPAWIKLVGTYLDTTEVAGVDPETQAASFHRVGLGEYFLYVFQRNSLVCTKRIDMLERGATLTLELDGRCSLVSKSGIREIHEGVRQH